MSLRGLTKRIAANHAVIKTAIFILLLTGCQTKSIRHEREISCDPNEHLYYVQQIPGCKECDRCWPGEEPDLQGVDLGMGLNGATKCPKCRHCSEGTYNPGGDIYWKCRTCTDCSASGLHEEQACTATRDTICSNNVRDVPERLLASSNSHENVHVGQKHEDEDLHKEKVIDVSVSVVITAVVVLVIVCVIAYKRKSLQRCFGNHTASTPEENVPLNRIEPKNVIIEEASENAVVRNPEEADDQLRDIRKNEKLPLVPKRTRHVSFGNYDNTVFGLDKDVEKDGEETPKKRNPAFRRQLSQPVTNREEKQIQYMLEKEDEKKRPYEYAEHMGLQEHQMELLKEEHEKTQRTLNAEDMSFDYISRSLQQRPYEYAEHMGLPKHQMELLKEEHEKTQRTLNAEDMSFDYISRSLQRKQQLAHSDVYNALRKLGLQTELGNILEKRQKRLI